MISSHYPLHLFFTPFEIYGHEMSTICRFWCLQLGSIVSGVSYMNYYIQCVQIPGDDFGLLLNFNLTNTFLLIFFN